MKLSQSLALTLAASVVFVSSTSAGVVFEVETTYHSGSADSSESTEISVDGLNLKMEIQSRASGEYSAQTDEAIYRGQRREMVAVDHRNQAYMVMDQETLRGIGGQVETAMKELEKRLQGLDPKQREMMEQMLKGRMGAPDSKPAARETSLRETTEKSTRQGYPCVRWDGFEGDEKVVELWVTEWKNLPGGTEVAGAFVDMAKFFSEIMASFPQQAGGGTGLFESDRNPFEHFERIGGFPVVTRSFEGGELESEAVLESVVERDLDPDAFEPPKGYRLRTMGPQ